jgi:hypothetical protein
MTIILSTNEEGNEGPGSNPNVQVQELGPAIFSPSQAIGNVVARTNDLLAGHREWLNSLPQRVEREQHQNEARDAPASKSSWLCHVAFLENSKIPCPSKLSDLSTSKLTSPGLVTPAPSLSKRFPIPQPQAVILPECSGFVASASASASASGSNIGFASASAKFAISLSSVSSTASATIASLQALSASQSTALQSASIALTSASSALASANSSAIAASSSAKSVQSSAASAILVAQASAQSAIISAQSSANAAVQSANNVANSALGTPSSSPPFNLTY